MTDQNRDGKNDVGQPDDEVGYGKPPKSGQFKPGESGNPRGRKRKPKSVRAQIESILSRKVTINEAGKTKQLPMQEVILRTIANKAAKGDLKAASLILSLMNAPEHADAVSIDQDTLSPEDQKLLDQFLSPLLGGVGTEAISEETLEPPDDEASEQEGSDPLAEVTENSPSGHSRNTTDAKDGSDDT